MTGRAASGPDTVGRAVGRLFGRDSVYMLVWGLQLFLAAAMTPFITRAVGVGEFGEIASAIAVMQVLFGLAGLGLQTAIQRVYARRGTADARRLLTLSVLVAVLVTAAADLTGAVWSRLLGFDAYETTLRLAVLWAGASAVTHAALGLLRSLDRLAAFTGVGLMQSVVAEAASLVLILAVRPTPLMFVLGRVLAQLAAVALALSVARLRRLRRADRALVLAGLAYALPLVPAELSTFVMNTADRLIVRHELGLDEVARYQLVYNLGSIPATLITLLNVAWMPRIFALAAGRERSGVLAASRDALYRLLMPVMIGLSLGMPILLRIWAPAQYRPDELLMTAAVVILQVVPYTAALSATRGLLAAGRSGAVAVAAEAGAVANFELNLLHVPGIGLLGAAAATTGAFAVMHGVLVARSRAVAPVPRPSPARLARLALAIAATLLVAGLPTDPMFLVVRGVLAAATLGWFLLVLRRLGGGPHG